MEMWFSELHTTNVKLSMRIEQQLCSVESDCQRIDVLVSDENFTKLRVCLTNDVPISAGFLIKIYGVRA